MARRGNVKVAITADSSGLRRGVSQAENDINRLQRTGRAAFKGLGVAATAGGAAAAAGMGVFAKSAIETASSIEESMSRNKVLFGENAKAIEDFSKSAARNFGISRAAAMEAAGGFGTFFTSAGKNKKEAADMSVTMTKLAADMASFNNTSVDDALTALKSGLSGETEPLRRYAVLMNDARLRQIAMREGMIKTTKEALTPQQKTLAAYALVMEQTKKQQGDYARTQDSFSNSLKTFKAEMSDLSATMGVKLLPVATGAVRSMMDFVQQLQSGKGAIGGFAADLREKLSGAFESVKDIPGKLMDSFSNSRKGGAGIGASIGTMITDSLKNADWDSIGKNIAESLRGAMDTAGNMAEGFYDMLRNIDAKVAGEALVKVMLGAIGAITNPEFWAQNWQLLVGVIISLFPLGKLIKLMGPLFKRVFAKSLDKVDDVVGSALSKLPKKFEDMGSASYLALRSGMSKMLPWFAGLGPKMKGFVIGAGITIGRALSGLGGVVVGGIQSVMRQGLAQVVDLVNNIISVFNAIPGLRNFGRVSNPMRDKSKNYFQTGFKQKVATGGWIGKRGQKGEDTVPALLGAGEFVLNRHQQPLVEQALYENTGLTLDDLGRKVRRPHSHARGGRVQAFGIGGKVKNLFKGIGSAVGSGVDKAKSLVGKLPGNPFDQSSLFYQMGGYVLAQAKKYIMSKAASMAPKERTGGGGGGKGKGGKGPGSWKGGPTLPFGRSIANKFGLRISSTYRSPAHNAAVGGVPNSLHTHGSMANPGAIDAVGTNGAMFAAHKYLAGKGLAENMVHNVGSGLHLHMGFFKHGGRAGVLAGAAAKKKRKKTNGPLVLVPPWMKKKLQKHSKTIRGHDRKLETYSQEDQLTSKRHGLVSEDTSTVEGRKKRLDEMLKEKADLARELKRKNDLIKDLNKQKALLQKNNTQLRKQRKKPQADLKAKKKTVRDRARKEVERINAHIGRNNEKIAEINKRLAELGFETQGLTLDIDGADLEIDDMEPALITEDEQKREEQLEADMAQAQLNDDPGLSSTMTDNLDVAKKQLGIAEDQYNRAVATKNPGLIKQAADKLRSARDAVKSYEEEIARPQNEANQAREDAQKEQNSLRAEVVRRAASLNEAFAYAATNSGDLGYKFGVSNGGGPVININTLTPGDPATLVHVANAATAGLSYQGSITSPRYRSGV